MGNYGYYIPKSETAIREQHESNKMRQKMLSEKYNEFTRNVGAYFLSEALTYILDKCIDEESRDISYERALCESFVREEGYHNLMKDFKTKTLFLAQLESCVSESNNCVMATINKDDELTFTIKDVSKQKFFDGIKKIPVDNLSKRINEKVCSAAEEFVQRNVNNKLDIEDAANKAKERIDTAKKKYDEKTAEKIKEQVMREYRGEVERIKSKRYNTVYEYMMNAVAKTVLESEELKSDYLNESGQFNVEEVENKVKCMYTFLEMVNTLKIKKITESYIRDCLSSISE